jgi:endo-1,4-beta-xylanase
MLELAHTRRIRPTALLAALLLAGCGSAAPICPSPPRGGAGAPFPSRIPLGAAVRWDLIESNPGYAAFFLSHYSWLTPENELKMNALQPGPGRFDFGTADALVNWARAHGKSVHGHVLVWGQQVPGWVSQLHSAAQAARVMARYIHTVATHFRGRIGEWDVVNEAFNSDGTYTHNVWLRWLGPAYIGEAFRLARSADPRLRLCYNDTGIELPGPHASAALALVRALRRQRLLDCVGFEVHTMPPARREGVIGNQFRRFTATGADAVISELDVNVETTAGGEAARLGAQARVYSAFARACLHTPRCVRITTWGFTDASSWLGSDAQALPFDARCRPKPAWDALKSALRR